MAAIDRTNYKRIQRSYYNINIYNDTNDDIEAKYSANTIVPLLDKPNQYEVSVVRASVPLDGIPISQYNIGFESWQVQFTNTQTNQTSNAYVQQFNPQPVTSYVVNTAIIGLLGSNLQTLTINVPTPPATPTGNLPLTVTPYPGPYLEQFTISGNLILSNIAYGFSSIYRVPNSNLVQVYGYKDGSLLYTIVVPPGAIIRAICATQLNDYFYIVISNSDGPGMEILFYDTFIAPPYVTFVPTTANTIINSISVNSNYLSVSFQISNVCQIINYDVTSRNSAVVALANQPAISDQNTIIYTYVDDSNNYYQADFFTIDRPMRPTIFQRFNIQLPQSPALQTYTYNYPNSFTRFLGIDLWGNILISRNVFPEKVGYDITAFNIANGGTSVYSINSPIEPMSLSVFGSQTINIPAGPSLTPNYQIWNYQSYLDQINIAIATAFNGIKGSDGWPTQEIPYLSYSNAKFSLNCGVGLAQPICKMSFNTRLWQRFIFNSSTNTKDSNYEDLQILSLIPNIVPTTTLMITQPHSTNYRWFDITRVIVRSTKMSVAGDVELTNTSLLNITDFAIDTSAPNILLQIYEPTILRYYQLYQTSPLNAIDVQLSYATRSGDIFAINLTAGSAASIKLLFRRSNFELAL